MEYGSGVLGEENIAQALEVGYVYAGSPGGTRL